MRKYCFICVCFFCMLSLSYGSVIALNGADGVTVDKIGVFADGNYEIIFSLEPSCNTTNCETWAMVLPKDNGDNKVLFSVFLTAFNNGNIVIVAYDPDISLSVNLGHRTAIFPVIISGYAKK